jgi:hypothetical protein
LLLWSIEADVFQMPQLHKHFNVSSDTMSTSKSTILFVGLLLAFFFIGLNLYGDFIQWFLLKRDNIVYQTYAISGQFQNSLFFAINLAAIPLFALLLGKNWQQKTIALGFIALCVVAALLVRRFLLSLSINTVPENTGEAIKYAISLDNLKINASMTIGLIIGYMAMFLYFKYQHKFNRPTAKTGLPKIAAKY